MTAKSEIRELKQTDSVEEYLPSKATYYCNYSPADDYQENQELYARGNEITRNPHKDSAIGKKKSEQRKPVFKAVQEKEREDDPYTPTQRTMRMLGNERQADEDPREDHRYRPVVNKRGITMIGIYAALVLTFAIVIAVVAVAIGALNDSVSALENELTEITAEMNDANSRLQEVSYPDISEVPEGFVKSEGGILISVPAFKTQAQSYAHGNWFDGLCKFFSGIFGG